MSKGDTVVNNGTKNPVLDSETYTFVSVETLRNTFPATVQRASDSETELTREEFTSTLRKVSRKISEPES